MLFTKPLVPDKLAAVGIVPPSDPSTSIPKETSSTRSFNFHGRIGRGGRIIFDRWNPLMRNPIETLYAPPKPWHSAPQWFSDDAVEQVRNELLSFYSDGGKILTTQLVLIWKNGGNERRLLCYKREKLRLGKLIFLKPMSSCVHSTLGR